MVIEMEGKVEEWQGARSISYLRFSLSITKAGFSPRENFREEELTWQWRYQYSIALLRH
jgi:hypothetical protein